VQHHTGGRVAVRMAIAGNVTPTLEDRHPITRIRQLVTDYRPAEPGANHRDIHRLSILCIMALCARFRPVVPAL
jgi:hypothetical protein